MSARDFTLPDFEALTPEFGGAERLAIWLRLPVDLQDQAWQELGERIERRARQMFAEYRLGDYCTVREVCAEIAAVWPECATVPTGHVGPVESPPRRSAPSRERSDGGDLDLLRSIPSRDYVPALTGRIPNRAGFIQCPFHGSGEERTPSLKVCDDPVWFCHGCSEGGDAFELYARLNDQAVPTGREFWHFAADLAGALREMSP
jgi:hypothetical protein